MLADLLDEEDRQGIKFVEESEGVATFPAALAFLSRYPWHRLLPLKLHPDYAGAVMAEVLRRGGAREEKRWREELSRRSGDA